MSDKEFTELPAVVTPATTDTLACDQGGITKKETVAQVLSNMDGYTSDITCDNADVSTAIKSDTINEHTAATGVTIDSLLLKDGYPQSGGVPIAGWLNDGTPFYRKEISVTITNGNQSGSAAHGISNAYSSDKIITATGRVDTGSYKYIRWYTPGNPWALYDIHWDDTDLKLYRVDTAGDYTWKVIVDYK